MNIYRDTVWKSVTGATSSVLSCSVAVLPAAPVKHHLCCRLSQPQIFGTSSASGTREVKAPFKASVMISVVKKKPAPAANGNIPGNSEEKMEEEQSVNNTSTGLLSLCQNYESDDD